MGGSAIAVRLPLVAVLLSTYNGAAYLQAQLESLRSQKGVHVHLYARDDGSTDETCAILGQYAQVWPDLNGFSSGPNLKPAGSFLHLLRTAPDHLDYYAFCDQDDVWQPDKLARAVAVLEKEAGPALYCSNVTCVAEDLKPLGIPPGHRDPKMQQLLFENVAIGCTVVLNRAARALINGQQPAQGVLMHDWWCALVVAALGRVHYDPVPGVLYRQHGGNMIGMDMDWVVQKVRQTLRLLRERRDYYPIHGQAQELLRLYSSQISPAHRAKLDRLVASKRSRLARVAYAMSGDVVHSRVLSAAVVRGLMLVGWY